MVCVCVCVCVCARVCVVVECSQSPYVRPVEGPGRQVTQGIVGEESAAEEGTGLVVWRVCVRTRAVRTHVLVSAMVSVLCGYDY